MTITRMLEGSGEKSIKRGDWACFAPLTVYGICGRPRLVLEVSGSRVYYSIGEKLVTRMPFDEYKSLKSVVFVCSTKEEADEVYRISTSQLEDTETGVREMIKLIADIHRKKIDELISTSASKSPTNPKNKEKK